MHKNFSIDRGLVSPNFCCQQPPSSPSPFSPREKGDKSWIEVSLLLGGEDLATAAVDVLDRMEAVQ